MSLPTSLSLSLSLRYKTAIHPSIMAKTLTFFFFKKKKQDLSESSHKTHCKPYDKAIKDKLKSGNSDEDSPLAAALDKASSANAYRDEFMASSTPLTGSSSSFAAATPTPGEG